MHQTDSRRWHQALASSDDYDSSAISKSKSAVIESCVQVLPNTEVLKWRETHMATNLSVFIKQGVQIINAPAGC